MRIRRTVIIPAVLALSTAGSILTVPVMAATQAPSVIAAAPTAHPNLYFRG
jgi:hypothetical protein